MKKNKTALLLAAMLLLAGCGSTTTTSTSDTSSYSTLTSNSITSLTKSASASYSDDVDAVYDAVEEFTVEEESESDYADSEVGYEEKLVYTCDLEMETLEYDDTVDAIHNLIDEYDAFIESETETDSNYGWYKSSSSTSGTMRLYMVVRVPSENYDDFVSGVSDAAQVMSKSSNVENITQQYYENENTIAALEIELDRLVEMMESAETISDMIQIEERLTEVEEELSSAENTKSYYDTEVSYSTVNITLEEVYEYVDTPVGYGTRLLRAVKNSALTFVEFLGDFVIWLIYALPYLVLIGAVVFGILALIRKIRKKRKMQKLIEKENKTNQKKQKPTSN